MAGKSAAVRVAILADNSSFKRGLKDSESSLKKFTGSVGKITKLVGAGAVVAGAAVGGIFVEGLKSAADYQKITARTNNVIKTTKGAAHISAQGVKELADHVESYSNVSDEAVQSGENLLLTFRNVRNEAGKGNDIFTQTTKLATDMSTALGTDVPTAAMQLGKALNDPTKGMSKLMRSGVSFTQQQVDMVKKLQASGDTLGAQKVILKEVNKEFGGAAKAAGSTFSGSVTRLKNSFSDLTRDALTPLLPVLTNVVDYIAKKGIPFVKDFAGKLSRIASLGWGKLQDAAGAVKDFFTNGAGHEPMVKAIQAIHDAASGIARGFKRAAGDVGDLKNKLGGLNLNKLDGKKIGTALGDAIRVAITAIGGMAGELTTAFEKLFKSVDWVGIGDTMGKEAPALLVGLAAGILNFDMGSLLKGIGKHWVDVLLGILTIAFAPAKFIGPIAKILEHIPFAGTILSKLLVGLNKVGGKVLEDLLRVLGGALKDAGRLVFKRFAPDTPQLIVKFMEGFAKLEARIGEFFLKLGVKLLDWGAKAAEKGARSIGQGLEDAVKFAEKIPGKITNALGKLGGMLKTAGFNAIRLLAAGITSGFVNVTQFVSGIPHRIKSAISGAGTLLLNVGKDIVGGLVQGIKDTAGNVLSTIESYITDKLPGWVKKPLGIGSPSKVMRELAKWIPIGIAKGIEDGSDSIGRVLDALTSFITKKLGDQLKAKQAAIKKHLKGKEETAALKKLDGAWKKHSKTVMSSVSDEYDALRKLGKQQDALQSGNYLKYLKKGSALYKEMGAEGVKNLDAARQKLRDLTSTARDFASSIKDSFVSFGDITQLGADDNGTVQLPALIDQLKQRAVDAKRFATLIRQLQKGGLNQAQIQQLLDAGPEAALSTAEAIASGGQDAINQINSLSTQIAQAGGSLGDDMSTAFYGAGIKAAQGLVDGLTKKQDQLDKAAESMAGALVRAVKKALKIHSPSQVFADLGSQVSAGLAIGVNDTHATRAGTSLAGALVAGFGQPQLTANAVGGTSARTLIEVKLTAQQVSQLERGRGDPGRP